MTLNTIIQHPGMFARFQDGSTKPNSLSSI